MAYRGYSAQPEKFSGVSIKHVADSVKEAKAHIVYKFALFSLYSLFI
jgi:hypothetical protein